MIWPTFSSMALTPSSLLHLLSLPSPLFPSCPPPPSCQAIMTSSTEKKSSASIAIFLVSNGASLDVKNKKDQTPLDLCPDPNLFKQLKKCNQDYLDSKVKPQDLPPSPQKVGYMYQYPIPSVLDLKAHLFPHEPFALGSFGDKRLPLCMLTNYQTAHCDL